MLRADRDAFICDLAETYGVLDWRTLPATLLGTLAAGLRGDSRVRMKMAGQKLPGTEMLLAAAVDRLTNIAWLLSAVCPKQGERPRSILSALAGEPEPSTGESVGFDTPEEYEAEWRRITGVGHGSR